MRRPEYLSWIHRNQYVLDLSRSEIRDYIYERISKIMRSALISYVKWDMNRPIPMPLRDLQSRRERHWYIHYRASVRMSVTVRIIRLAGFLGNHSHDCWQIVSKDKNETLVTYI